MKTKPKINFIIDAVMFILMMAIGGIGFLIKYSLLSGSDRWRVYEDNVELYLWGMDRHQWGAIHLALGFILLALLVLHIALHWKLITAYFRQMVTTKSARTVSLLVFCVVSLAALLFAFFLPIDLVALREGQGQHRIERAATAQQAIIVKKQEQNQTSAKNEDNAEQLARRISINGSMTLRQVALAAGVPADSLKAAMGLPSTISDNERLSVLRRRYGFHMSDIERWIENDQRRHR